MIRRRALSLFLAVFLGAVQFGQVTAAPGSDANQARTPIKHLVVLLQENHTFDNYFGTYPGADGIPVGTTMPIDPSNPTAGSVTPWHIGNSTITDLSHTAVTFRGQYDNGKMDGFVSYLNSINQKGQLSMGYYDGSDIPYYWNLADSYVLFDRFFSSAADGSFANHMYWVAGVSPVAGRGQQLSDLLANVPTIFDRLQAAGVSWKFYVENYDPEITYRNQANAGNRASQVIWVPLLNFDRFIDDPNLSSHIVNLDQYYVDLENGTLPAVSYIVPSGASEHPPQKPVTGERTVKNLIQELMRSSSWDSSAFLLLYDDWGGWYDHVTPPQVDNFGYGLRVPGILVSPYAREGFIDNTQLDFTSVLKFIEENWTVPSLASRDAAANNFLEAFDFTQSPRPPEFIPSTRASLVATTTKKGPTSIIYMTYGLAVLLSALVIGTAYASHYFFRPRQAENNKR
jgi:phospholipase C